MHEWAGKSGRTGHSCTPVPSHASDHAPMCGQPGHVTLIIRTRQLPISAVRSFLPSTSGATDEKIGNFGARAFRYLHRIVRPVIGLMAICIYEGSSAEINRRRASSAKAWRCEIAAGRFILPFRLSEIRPPPSTLFLCRAAALHGRCLLTGFYPLLILPCELPEPFTAPWRTGSHT